MIEAKNLDPGDDFPSLHAKAWTARVRNPESIGRLSDQIIEASERGSVERAWGIWHRAVWLRFKRVTEEVEESLAEAEAIFSRRREFAGLAMCYEQRARVFVAAGNEVEARRIAAVASHHGQAPLSRWERFALADLEVVIATRFSTPENTLRALARAIAAARETDDAAAIAQTLSMLAGKHAELNNYETALVHGSRAIVLAREFKPGPCWYITALNLLLIRNGMGDAANALELADELEQFDETFFPPIREQSNLLYARAYLLNRELEKAQASLNRSRALVPVQGQAFAWTGTQAAVLHARAEHEAALRLCEELISSTTDERARHTPSAALRIYRTAAASAEALGKFDAALAYERKAVEFVEIELGRAALARRVELEIEFELDRERAEREESERKRIESESERVRLDELNRKLDAALQTRTRFLAAASHDLRQPAHALALYATALEQETSRAALNELAKRMRATVGSLSNMFDGLLELARLDAGAIAPQFEPFDLSDLLDRLCIEYRDRLTSENAVLRFRKPRRACWVASDAVMVERIFRNLIGNAVKYSAGANVMVAVRSRSSGIAIEIRDGGPGMSDEEQRRVFDEFFRAKSAASQRDGLGLGLSIVDRFAKLLGFAVSLRSEQGAGTTFSVLIPTTSLSSQASISQELAKPLGKAVKRRLFVIDDDGDARESMTLVLSQWGHDCLAAASAAELLPLASERGFTPDALISDFQLADSTAIESIRQVRSCYGDALPVLVVSGSHDAEAQLLSVFPDAAYLPKPVRPLRLKSWIANVRAPGA